MLVRFKELPSKIQIMVILICGGATTTAARSLARSGERKDPSKSATTGAPRTLLNVLVPPQTRKISPLTKTNGKGSIEKYCNSTLLWSLSCINSRWVNEESTTIPWTKLQVGLPQTYEMNVSQLNPINTKDFGRSMRVPCHSYIGFREAAKNSLLSR